MIATIYDTATGRYLRFVEGPDALNIAINVRPGETAIDGEHPENSRLVGGEVQLMPDRPIGDHWDFDAASESWIDPRPAAEIEAEQIAELRRERDRRLAASDWTQMPDAPLSPTLREAWRIYRQALRDMPDTQDPAAPEWPSIPTEDNP